MVRIISANADYSASLEYALPVSGARYWNFFFGLASTNLGSGGSQAVVGSPAKLTGYYSFNAPSDYVDTGVLLPASATLLVVAKTPVSDTTAVGATFIGNWASSAGVGSIPAGAYISPRATGIRGSAVANNGGTTVNMIEDLSVDEMAWRFIALTVNGGVSTSSITIADLTANVSSTETQSFPLRASNLTVKIGANPAAPSFTSDTDIAFGAVYDRALSVSEIASIYTAVRAVAARSAISI